MPRHAPVLECSADDKASLTAISTSRTEEARMVERARIILASLEGKEIQGVARELGISIPTVSKWRQRFALWGLRGLFDRPRSGKPVTYDNAFRNRVLSLLEQPPPPGMSHWDGPAVAEKLGASVRCGAFFGVKAFTCKGCAVGASVRTPSSLPRLLRLSAYTSIRQ